VVDNILLMFNAPSALSLTAGWAALKIFCVTSYPKVTPEN